MNGIAEHEAPDQATVSAYLANQLDPSDAEAFEIYCLRNPEFARRVELDLLFRTGLRRIQGTDQAHRTGRRRHILFALAACLTLVICGALLLMPRIHSGTLLAYRSTSEVPQALLAGPRVSMTLIRVRDGSAVHRIAAPQGAGVLAIRVAPDAPPGRLGYAMGIAVESEVLSRSAALDDLHPEADGYIKVYLPITAVVGQTLRITVRPSPATDADPLTFRLQVADAQIGSR